MPRLQRTRVVLLTGGAVLLCGALVIPVIRQSVRRAEAAEVVRSQPLVDLARGTSDESAVRDRDIEFYAQRAATDRESASDRAALAGLLFSRARTSGSTRDLDRAEAAARESIALRGSRNSAAFELLATILMSRHAFVEAHAVASQADSLAPGTPSHLALLGEIELELGEYDAAATHFRAVQFDGQQFTIGARIARWYELTGRAAEARAMLQRATAQVAKRDDLPREQAAWFDYRLGELELRVGRPAAADSAFRHGLQQHPGDLRILGALSRSALAQGAWRRAVAYGEESLAEQLDPGTLGTLSVAWNALGDSAQAAQYTQAMSVAALSQPVAIHRAWGLHLLDHGSNADRSTVLRLAQEDIRVRRDVYGYDLLAWALHRAGRSAEARVAMRKAMARGTEDVALAAHARDILGNSAVVALQR